MKSILTTATFLAVLAPSIAKAEADEGPTKSQAVAPAKAWELTLGQGYSQGFGRAKDGANLSDFARGGFSLQLGLGYRIDPRLMVGIYAEGSRYSASNSMPDDTTAYGAAFGAQANWHFMPVSRIDPWVGLGTGVRGYFIDSPAAPAEAFYGYDIARVRVGADYRLSPSVRLGPLVGATATTFLTRHTVGNDPVDNDHPGISTVLFAGMQGRFDIGGSRISEQQMSVASL